MVFACVTKEICIYQWCDIALGESIFYTASHIAICPSYSAWCTQCSVSHSDQASVPPTIFRSISKFDKNLQCPSLKCAQSFITQFGTCHDSHTTVIWATYRYDRLSILKTRPLQNFNEFRIWSQKNLAGRVPEHLNWIHPTASGKALWDVSQLIYDLWNWKFWFF